MLADLLAGGFAVLGQFVKRGLGNLQVLGQFFNFEDAADLVGGHAQTLACWQRKSPLEARFSLSVFAGCCQSSRYRVELLNLDEVFAGNGSGYLLSVGVVSRRLEVPHSHSCSMAIRTSEILPFRGLRHRFDASNSCSDV